MIIIDYLSETKKKKKMLLPQEILKYYVILQRLLLGPSAETEPDDRTDGAWKLKNLSTPII